MVANSFDLWLKDAFFSAAEEVQESADIMESAYRLWIREKREGRAQETLDELVKELKAALGTAKWQLEQFEKAVRLGHGRVRDDTKSTRHKQFIAALENQIFQVEGALDKTFSEEGKQPFCWVNLNKEECDDLAMFLSGASEASQTFNRDSTKLIPSSITEDHKGRNEAPHEYSVSSGKDDLSKIWSHNNNNTDIDIEKKGSLNSADDRISQTDQTVGVRKSGSSTNWVALRIEVPGEEEKNELVAGINTATKEKGSKSLFGQQRSLEYNLSNPVKVLNQLFGRDSDRQRQRQGMIRLPFSRSIQLTLALMLMVFLILPFYST